MRSPYDVEALRSRFPALQRSPSGGRVPAYLDGPAGTQVPETVIEAMARVHRLGISNLGGGFPSSRAAEEITAAARSAVADLYGARPDEIVFGQNMTSLTFAASRALAREWEPGDEVVVTLLDHDANVTPWRSAAADRGVTVRTVPFDRDTGILDMDALQAAVGERTRLVAVTHASNALGTIPDVAAVVDLAHSVGALAFVDAVHYAPHGIIDVGTLQCDFLVSSAYKFYGPHTGALFARREHLERLVPYKVVPAPSTGPGKWETGTQSFESLAGVTAAVDHLASIGEGSGRRDHLLSAQHRVRNHESTLATRFMDGVAEIPAVRLYGITRPELVDLRTPTFAVEVTNRTAQEVAAYLADADIYVWAGHYYAVGVMGHLGVMERGGLVRIGFVQYSTAAEVDRVLEALDSIAAS